MTKIKMWNFIEFVSYNYGYSAILSVKPLQLCIGEPSVGLTENIIEIISTFTQIELTT